ncbi:MAG: hypothetical protein KBD01_14635 [Acidobacteria bacterium]|nr:hypothetical protein [Acidobacteriota bacterium]
MRLAAISTALLAVVACAGAAAAQTDVVPPELAGEWAPAGSCAGPLKLVLTEHQATLVNGADKVTHGNLAVTGSYFGHDYQGIMTVLLPDYDKSQPYVVTFNADEKRGDTTIEIRGRRTEEAIPVRNRGPAEMPGRR